MPQEETAVVWMLWKAGESMCLYVCSGDIIHSMTVKCEGADAQKHTVSMLPDCARVISDHRSMKTSPKDATITGHAI